jgi:hypothetical protein
MSILILDAGRQVDFVFIVHALIVLQLCVQDGFTVRAIPLKNDVGRIIGEVLGTPCEFTYGASSV